MWRHSPPDHYLFKIYSKTFYSVYDKDRNWPFLDIFLHNTTSEKRTERSEKDGEKTPVAPNCSSRSRTDHYHRQQLPLLKEEGLPCEDGRLPGHEGAGTEERQTRLEGA